MLPIMLMSLSQRPHTLVVLIGVWALAGNLKCVSSEQREICERENLDIDCGPGSVLQMTSAEYGHLAVGRCIKLEDDYLGCKNDVLHLLDRWCSGKQSCQVQVSNADLDAANTECLHFLKLYLLVDYTCTKVTSCSSSTSKTTLTAPSGTLSSHVTAQTGCGSPRSPWLIQASPGQTVDVTLVDFGADGSQSGSSFVTCQRNYGFILERALGINHTICGGNARQNLVYQSKMNTVEITMSSAKNQNDQTSYLIEYSVQGCKDMTRPPNAWYKREEDEAVIGCETNDQEWRLTCSGNTWHGTVGNCSEPVVVPVVDQSRKQPNTSDLSVHSLVILTAIIGGAVVVIVAAIMCGVIHMKKYKLRQDRKRIQLHVDYATLGRKPGAVCKPQIPNDNLICMDPPQHHNVLRDGSEREPIWKMPLPDPHGNNTSHPGDNTQGTLTSRGQSESANLMENFVAKYCPLEN